MSNPLKRLKKATIDRVDDVLKGTVDAVGDVGTGLYKQSTRYVRNLANETQNIVENVGHEHASVLRKIGAGIEDYTSKAGHETYNAVHKAGHEISNAWDEGGLRDAVAMGALVAGAIATGGAVAGAFGVAGASAGAALGSTAGIVGTGLTAAQTQQSSRAAYKTEQAQAEYNRQVQKANREALEERKSSLLKTKKQLTPNLMKSSQGGFSGGIEELEIKLG